MVVPVFNGLPHLTALVESLLAQTYQNLEFVFSEGGGNDESLSYLRSLDDPRIRIIETQNRISPAGNWTKASEEAGGAFIKLVCQDDLLYTEAIAQQVADLQANPSAVMATARRDIVDAKGRVIFRNRGLAGVKETLLPGETVIRQCYLQGTNVIGEPLAVLFRTEALKASLPWRDENPLMLDLSMYSKVAPLGDIATRSNAVGAFRVSDSSWSTRLAKTQLEQTRRWQEDYANTQLGLTTTERTRATLGRHLHTNLRRAAYAFLNARGRLGN